MSTTTSSTQSVVTVKFHSLELTGLLRHDNARRMLLLLTDNGIERISTNLAGYGLDAPEGHVFVKDWSEHTGLAQSLQAAGVGKIVGSSQVGPFGARAYLVKVLAQ